MAKRVERLKADFVKKCGPGLYCDGGGLWLKATEGADGSLDKWWVFRYAAIESDEQRRQRKAERKRQKERQMGLGPLDLVSLPEARGLAREKAQMRAAGEDPLDAVDRKKDARRVERAAAEATKRSEANQAPIFDRAMDAYYEANRSSWRSQLHSNEWRDSLIRHVSPLVGGKRIDQIVVADLLGTLKPIWRTIPVTASRVRARIERVLDHGYVHTFPDDMERAAELVAKNPARMNAHLKRLLGANTHTKLLARFSLATLLP
jgi:hypothetical protein